MGRPRYRKRPNTSFVRNGSKRNVYLNARARPGDPGKMEKEMGKWEIIRFRISHFHFPYLTGRGRTCLYPPPPPGEIRFRRLTEKGKFLFSVRGIRRTLFNGPVVLGITKNALEALQRKGAIFFRL